MKTCWVFLKITHEKIRSRSASAAVVRSRNGLEGVDHLAHRVDLRGRHTHKKEVVPKKSNMLRTPYRLKHRSGSAGIDHEGDSFCEKNIRMMILMKVTQV